MTHRTDYRIVKISKEGYYTYYRVQRRVALFFWVDDSAAYDRHEQAVRWINDQLVEEIVEVVE